MGDVQNGESKDEYSRRSMSSVTLMCIPVLNSEYRMRTRFTMFAVATEGYTISRASMVFVACTLNVRSRVCNWVQR